MINKNFKNENKFYINIDLTFFSGEKTEKATPKKKEKARKEGQVAISKEIATAITLIVGFLSLKLLGKYMYKKCFEIMTYNFNLVQDIDSIIDDKYLIDFFIYITTKVFIICAPIFLILAFIGLVTSILQVGWHPTTKPLIPKFNAFNPVNGLKRMFSAKQIVETLISILKIIFIGFVIYNEISKEIGEIRNIVYMDLFQAVIY
ncbi:MAG: EscU/YscU/HrcU family type III secretion system export apparatus switch protein, partial [Eubacteriales bacterium]|nr:EscU/YscU/HrcU family type III secretion system export apparatus switch protein [Eubacteriales bacterium]